ncbi:hypothetical protein [Streptomyces sp. S.PB5]|uniref:hypothetical protein n=1 Tax=Streptomyces sp. S.PB5 TaxID=3020844 RepID=UPI0025B105AE|nr:hypothetical protein [Streptomyces sp. S.PB5]MDN3021567.1 hypothetical protein [Streptomyces sp. S.PB5]
MSATIANGAASAAGKSTHAVGDATRTLATLPQAPYADAIHAELAEAGLPPQFLELGVEWGAYRVLFLRLVWPPQDDLLGATACADGLSLRWSHTGGWSAHTATGSCLLPIVRLAEPLLVVDAAQHYAKHGLLKEWVEPFDARWTHAGHLDAALAAWQQREASQ